MVLSRTLLLICTSIVLSTLFFVATPAHSAEKAEALTGLNNPDSVTKKTELYIKAIQDSAIEIADKKGVWLPDGFFDGPHKDDIFLAQLRMMFGQPVTHIYNIITNAQSQEDVTTTHITLATLYAKLMNSIGVIIIFCIVFFSSIGFLAKRSMDISYLTVQKEEVLPFIMARGGLGVLTSYPIPMLGGMSLLQGITLTFIILGVGAATSIIRYSIPYILSPGMMFTPQPHVAQFVDFVLEAKTCSIAMGKVAGDNAEKYKTSSAYTIQSDMKTTDTVSLGGTYIRKVARFGANGNGDCGEVIIADYFNASFESKDLSSLSRQITNETMATYSELYLKEIWEEPLIHNIAVELNEEPKESSFGKAYADYRMRMQDQMIGNIVIEMRSKFSTSLTPGDSSNTISERFTDQIANLGFMALGSFYTMLSYQQMEVNEILSNAFYELAEPKWLPTNTESTFRSIWRSFTSLDWFKNQPEQISLAKNNLQMFIKSSSKYLLDKDPKNVMDKAMAQYTSSNIGQRLGQIIVQVARSDSNGVYFPNPIIEMRNVGDAIIDTATLIAGVGAVATFAPTGKVAGAVGSITKKMGNIGEKSGVLITTITLALLTVGVFYSFIIPNLPYIMWSIAVFSYLSYAISSVIAAGWWGGAMAMSNPQNERSFSGRFHEGGSILLTLVLKPSLMTISFFIAMMLNVALGYYLQWTLEAASVSASYGGFNIWAFMGVLIVNGIIMTAGVIKNHSLIWELPDQFQRMLGFRSAIDDKSHDQAQQTAQTMSASIGGNLKSVAMTGLKKPGFDSH